jgi:hypothetical protein
MGIRTWISLILIEEVCELVANGDGIYLTVEGSRKAWLRCD